MDTHQPPPVLFSARVVAYVAIDSLIEYTGRTLMLVNGKALGRVKRLAICESLAEPRTIFLLHCDDSWNGLAAVGADTVDDAKAEAERNYPGLMGQWKELGVTREQALEYYDADGPTSCSFCGKRDYEIERMIEGANARICGGCVEEFYTDLREGE